LQEYNLFDIKILELNFRKSKYVPQTFKTKPFDHQLQALGCSWDKTNFAYFMEMGTGKSKVLLDNIAMLYDQKKLTPL